MSKIWKGIKKVFKKIVKVIKKVVPIILAVAAIYFTAGAALGITGAGGGWAAAGKIGAIFGEGIVASTVTSAVYQASIGAAIGGIVSKATGGSFTQGAQRGAVIGAVTGGFTGAMNFTPPAGAEGAGGATTFQLPESAQITGQELAPLQGPPVPTGSEAATMNAATGGQSAMANLPLEGVTAPTPAAATTPVAAATTPAAAAQVPPPPPPPKPGFFEKGGWLNNNQTLAGGAISGLGQGIMSGSAYNEGDFLRDKFELTAANYEGTDPGRNFRSLAGSEEIKDRYDPRSYGSWEYQYDPVQGRIIKVPAGGQGS